MANKTPPQQIPLLHDLNYAVKKNQEESIKCKMTSFLYDSITFLYTLLSICSSTELDHQNFIMMAFVSPFQIFILAVCHL